MTERGRLCGPTRAHSTSGERASCEITGLQTDEPQADRREGVNEAPTADKCDAERGHKHSQRAGRQRAQLEAQSQNGAGNSEAEKKSERRDPIRQNMPPKCVRVSSNIPSSIAVSSNEWLSSASEMRVLSARRWSDRSRNRLTLQMN